MRRIKAWLANWCPWVSKKRHQALRRQYVAALLELAAAKENEDFWRRHYCSARYATDKATIEKLRIIPGHD